MTTKVITIVKIATVPISIRIPTAIAKTIAIVITIQKLMMIIVTGAPALFGRCLLGVSEPSSVRQYILTLHTNLCPWGVP